MPRTARTDLGPDAIDLAVGQSIVTRRRAMGATQTQLAEALGVTFQQVQKYERGTNRVSASMLARAAAFFGCHPGDLFPDADAAGETGRDLMLTAAGRALLSDLPVLDDWALDALAQLARRLRERSEAARGPVADQAEAA